MEVPQLEIEPSKILLLYDGVCNLCNLTVQFIIKRDKKDRFRFAAFQSETAKTYIDYVPKTNGFPQSVAVVVNDQLYMKSNAILKICWELGGFWALMIVWKIIPSFIRNYFYTFIADRRYKYFGRRATCLMPKKEYVAKFLF